MLKSSGQLRRLALMASVVVLSACGPKPGLDDVRDVLRENLPEGLRDTAVIDQVQPEMTIEGDSVAVKFKSQLKTAQPLYSLADPKSVAANSGGDLV